MMKLFWSSRSPFARKVMIVAGELGIAGEIETVRVAVNPAKPHPDVMAFNPLSKIPTLVIGDGLVLYDSRVICEYLDRTYGMGSIFPADGRERWLALRHQAHADGIMENDLMWLNERNRSAEARLPAIIAACRVRIGAALDLLEGSDDFLASGKVTIGQIATVSALAHLDFRFPDEPWRDGRPKLAAWFAGFSERPSVRATAFVDQY